MSTVTVGIIGDVHAQYEVLDRVLARIRAVGVDAIVLVGDIGGNHLWRPDGMTPERIDRYLVSLREVLANVRALGVPVRWIPGNHDLTEFPDEAVLAGNVDGRVDDLIGLRIAGLGGSGEPFGFPNEWVEADAERRLAAIPDDIDVLVVHTPPRDTVLSQLHGNIDIAGSSEVYAKALRLRGFLVCGHIHESAGTLQLGACLCVNAGGLGDPHGKAQVAFIRRTTGANPVDIGWVDDLEADRECSRLEIRRTSR